MFCKLFMAPNNCIEQVEISIRYHDSSQVKKIQETNLCISFVLYGVSINLKLYDT